MEKKQRSKLASVRRRLAVPEALAHKSEIVVPLVKGYDFLRAPLMANQVHLFRDRDIKRVIKASRAAGVEIDAIEVDPTTGLIRIIAGRSSIGDQSGTAQAA